MSCPVDHNSLNGCSYNPEQDINPLNQMESPNQHPAPGQSKPLSTERETSTIPMAGKDEKWIYPSEQVVCFDLDVF